MIKKEKRVHIISWMLEKLKSIQIWLERKEVKLKKDNPNKINFHALTPVVDVEKKQPLFTSILYNGRLKKVIAITLP